MSDESAPRNLPAVRRTLDRAALERVLARASELQATGGESYDHLSEEQILELGAEVGISATHLRQALAEERTAVTLAEPSGALDKHFGPTFASAARTVWGKPADVLAVLDLWMQREECLKVKRRFGERVVWQARKDFLGNIKRGLDFQGKGYALTKAEDVSATVVAVDANRTLLRLDADLGRERSGRILGASVIGTIGAGATGIGFVLGVFAPVAVLPVMLAAGAGYLNARGHRESVEKVQLALEQILDRLEHGEKEKPTLLGMLQAAARSALSD
jgi:hypothetical protein